MPEILKGPLFPEPDVLQMSHFTIDPCVTSQRGGVQTGWLEGADWTVSTPALGGRREFICQSFT